MSNSTANRQSRNAWRCEVSTRSDVYHGVVLEFLISVRGMQVDSSAVTNITVLRADSVPEYTVKIHKGSVLKCAADKLKGTLTIAVEGIIEPVIIDLQQITVYKKGELL